MATIRKKKHKWEVQIRRVGLRPISKSFHALKDAEAWARHMEVQADRRDLPPDRKELERVTLGELVERYRTTVSIKKRSYDKERYFLKVFGDHPLCRKFISEITTTDFASYRDERLREVKPASVKRELAPIQNLFEVATKEWGLPLRGNPLDKLLFPATNNRRERRLRPGELDKLIEGARSRRNRLIATIIQFAVETGMRRSEIVAIEWRHVSCQTPVGLRPESSGRLRQHLRLMDCRASQRPSQSFQRSRLSNDLSAQKTESADSVEGLGGLLGRVHTRSTVDRTNRLKDLICRSSGEDRKLRKQLGLNDLR